MQPEAWKGGSAFRSFSQTVRTIPRPPNAKLFRKNLLASKGVSAAAVALLGDGELDTLALGEGDPGLLLSDDDNVGLTSGELVVNGILQVDNVEATIVTLTVGDDTNTAHVTTTGDHDDDTSVELDEVLDLAGSKVNLDGVVDLDGGVRVTDATRIVSIYHKTSPDPGRMPGARGFPAQHLAQTWSNV